jgi:hypothetical protein
LEGWRQQGGFAFAHTNGFHPRDYLLFFVGVASGFIVVFLFVILSDEITFSVCSTTSSMILINNNNTNNNTLGIINNNNTPGIIITIPQHTSQRIIVISTTL